MIVFEFVYYVVVGIYVKCVGDVFYLLFVMDVDVYRVYVYVGYVIYIVVCVCIVCFVVWFVMLVVIVDG